MTRDALIRQGKMVAVEVPYNLPLRDGRVLETTRTVYLLDDGRVLQVGSRGRSNVWVDVENGVWYNTLYNAVDDRQSRPVDRLVNC